ncbi:MAG: hypothetical protein MI919_31565, partial [Holophagales bacterium]|nr:hypothetical protein [Holophagales bacterium]
MIDESKRGRVGVSQAGVSRLAVACSCLGLVLWLAACGTSDPGHDHDETHAGDEEKGGESWTITAWGTHFEVFPEVEMLVAGQSSEAYVHVTRLEGFTPLSDGAVEIVLSSAAGEQVWSAEAPARPGIFTVRIEPAEPAELELAFRVSSAGIREEIRGGRVRVGTADQPGGLLEAPAPKGGAGEPNTFLKEEQWQGDLATSWVRRGELPLAVEGLARLQPPAGGEAVLSSPVDGVVHAAGEWPFPGMGVVRGRPILRIVPRIAADRSLAALEAETASLEIEKTAVSERLDRLEELFRLEATSRREVEE